MGGTKKLHVFALTAVVILATVAATGASARPKSRTVEATYHTPAAIVEVAGGGAYACSPNAGGGTLRIGCVDVPVKPTERFVTVEVLDASGLPAPIWVGQEGEDLDEYICGSGEKPIRIAPGLPVTIWVYPYRVDPLCEGISTTGTIELTFSS